MSLAAAIAPRAGKILENGLNVFERGKNFLWNGTSNFLFGFSQLSEIALES